MLTSGIAPLFSSNDPNTPMKRAFLAHTLMRKDHDEHRTERMAMMPALMPKTIESVWAPLYAKLAAAYLDRLPRGEVVDLFPALAPSGGANFSVMTVPPRRTFTRKWYRPVSAETGGPYCANRIWNDFGGPQRRAPKGNKRAGRAIE